MFLPFADPVFRCPNKEVGVRKQALSGDKHQASRRKIV